MGRMLEAALSAAGLKDLAARALEGKGLDPDDMERVRAADTLLVSAMADAVRATHRGDRVRLLDTPVALAEAQLVRVDADSGGGEGITGEEILREVAYARLSTPAGRSVGVCLEALGLELAQTALIFGADVLWGDLAGRRTLPLLDGPEARRAEIAGLVQRSGREPVWQPTPALPLEQHS